MRVWAYFSISSSATRALFPFVSLTRSSPPTSAVTHTDFGAEKVAFYSARCSIVCTVSPLSLMYSRACCRRTGASHAAGYWPSE